MSDGYKCHHNGGLPKQVVCLNRYVWLCQTENIYNAALKKWSPIVRHRVWSWEASMQGPNQHRFKFSPLSPFFTLHQWVEIWHLRGNFQFQNQSHPCHLLLLWTYLFSIIWQSIELSNYNLHEYKVSIFIHNSTIHRYCGIWDKHKEYCSPPPRNFWFHRSFFYKLKFYCTF